MPVRDTILKMLRARRYYDLKEEEGFITGALKDGGKVIVMFFLSSPKLNIGDVQECLATMARLGYTHSIVVYRESITPSARKVITELLQYTIETFKEAHLKFDVVSHSLVPPHQALSPKSAADFKQRYGTKFPALLKRDPVARYYNFQKGDIVCIHRENEVVFRIVK